MLLIVFAALFVVVLFFLKNKTTFKNETGQNGLVYGGKETLADLINKDTDKDGIVDWEESLWGTDPTKKDTNDDGILDSVEIEKIKSAQGKNTTVDYGGVASVVDGEKLTETDKLSRELFSTIATLNQAGDIDRATVDKITSSVAEKIQNSAPKKIFLLSELKVIKDDSAQAVNTYNDALNKIYNQNSKVKYTVLDVLDKFIVDENNVDESVLSELGPLITQTNSTIDAMVKTNVPPSLVPLHLDLVNTLQKLSENMSNIRLFNTDIILAMSGISQYQTNTDNLENAVGKLANAISQKLK